MSTIKATVLGSVTMLLFSCNNQSSHSNEHAQHADSSMHQHVDSSAASDTKSEMKALMDAMMTKMHAQKSTGNNDIDYANMMLQHHQGAVDMAKLQLEKGSNTVLKEFSKKVIEDQQKEIGIMGEFISRAKADSSKNAAIFKMKMDSSMQTMMMAAPKIYNDIDKDFVAQMIPHHQSAVDMAKAYLLFPQSPVLKQLSESIVSSQQKEIEWLKEWLNKNG